jgi:dipeptidyl aminopeptidase/acylaminoacyl peptidase
MKMIARIVHCSLFYVMFGFYLFCSSAQSFTIEEILSVPYPGNPVAGTNSMGWVLDDQGVRNIWLASGPHFKPVKITQYTEDDGQELSSLVFNQDDSILIYVRGGAAMQMDTTDLVASPSGSVSAFRNGQAEFPNPSNNPNGAEQAIWAVSTRGGDPWQLALGSNPVVYPDGKTVLFSRQGQLYEVPLEPRSKATMAVAKQLFKSQGFNKNPAWSPDGKSLLFVSDRDTHSLIGIYRLATEAKAATIDWIMPGVDRDMSPVWSPDSSRIAFIRVPGKTKYELFDLTAEFRFSIFVANVTESSQTSGMGQEIWRTPDAGGWAEWYPQYAEWFASALRWGKNDRILFYSEHQGWLHIYSTTPEGVSPVDLTPGESEVWGSTLSADGQTLYYSTNRQHLDFRHIWQSPTQGGEVVQLTKGDTIGTNPIFIKNGPHLAFRQATPSRPQAITLKNLASGSVQVISPKSLPDTFPTDIIVPESVIFPSDEFQIHGQLFMPENIQPGAKLPVVIFVHGGPFRQMLLGWHHADKLAKSHSMNLFLANQGYVVLSVNFRSGTGYGLAFRRAEMQGPRGASEYRDILAAVAYLHNLPEVDPKRISIWGRSCGGYLTALALARNSDLFAAGVAISGIYDFSFRATNMSVPGGEWGIKGEKGLALAYRSSPVADIAKWKSPVLLGHGDGDRSVIFAQTVNLVQGLREQEVEMELLILPGEMHGFVLHKNWLRTFTSTKRFLDRILLH